MDNLESTLARTSKEISLSFAIKRFTQLEVDYEGLGKDEIWQKKKMNFWNKVKEDYPGDVGRDYDSGMLFLKNEGHSKRVLLRDSRITYLSAIIYAIFREQ